MGPRAVGAHVSVRRRRDSSVKRLKEHRLMPLLAVVAQVFIFILASVPASAWQSDQESAPEQQNQGYPVMVAGYEVFRIHQPLGAALPQERAQRISARLEELASASDLDPAAITIAEEGGVTTIRYGDGLIVTLNDAEARGSGLPRQALASQYA